MYDSIPLHSWPDGDNHCLAFGVDPVLAAVVERRVPPSHLEYDVRGGLWRIRGAYWLALVELLCEQLGFGHVVPYKDESHYRKQDVANATPILKRADATQYGVLHLLPSAPLEVVDAAYIAMSKLMHPDRGGDTRAMVRLNQARDAITPPEQRRAARTASA